MIQFNKIIRRLITGRIEDFFVCDCLLDELLEILFSDREFSYDEMVKLLEEKHPSGHFFLNFFDSSIMMCKETFLYYRIIRGCNFVKESCCPELLKIDGQYTTVCLICFMRDVMQNSKIFNHLRLVDRFRINGTYLYMQLPIRTIDENVYS